MTGSMNPVAIEIDEDIRARVKRLADARHRSPVGLMREAISQYVEREERRESFRHDAVQAAKSYDRTGLYVTADEADAWLAELEQGRDVNPPSCHG